MAHTLKAIPSCAFEGCRSRPVYTIHDNEGQAIATSCKAHGLALVTVMDLNARAAKNAAEAVTVK